MVNIKALRLIRRVQFTALRVLLFPNTTANHAITYTNSIRSTRENIKNTVGKPKWAMQNSNVWLAKASPVHHQNICTDHTHLQLARIVAIIYAPILTWKSQLRKIVINVERSLHVMKEITWWKHLIWYDVMLLDVAWSTSCTKSLCILYIIRRSWVALLQVDGLALCGVTIGQEILPRL